ncbi:AsmA family protein [Flaviflagellibacter deserti]|uniref:AsmA-like C-terminal region-containing protein n=1 Tax=Flaviflagellibacter deserti TaxID=2267266 RepID=A0ABV9Z5V6_9HYPH
MTNTLTGLGIALLLALATALIGPLFIDWTTYRSSFEAQASRVMGVPVRVLGDVEARILPSPRIRFGNVVAGDEWDSAKLEADSFSLDMALMPLLSGSYHVSNLRIDGANLKTALAANGEVTLPVRNGGVSREDLDRVRVEKLSITRSKLTLADPAANRMITIDNLALDGEAAALAGPLKLQGSGTVDGQRYSLRAGTGEFDQAGNGRVELAVEGPDGGTLSVDGSLTLGALPRIKGKAVYVIPPGEAAEDRPARSRLKLQAQIEGDPRRLVSDTVDVQLGDEGSGTLMSGTGELSLRGVPALKLDLNARQVDVDRSLARPKEVPPLTPADALGAYSAQLPVSPSSALNLQLRLSAEGVVLAGDIVQNLRAEVSNSRTGWTIDNLAFRAPGGGDVKTAGAVTFEGGPGYAGLLSVDVSNMPSLVRWLEGATATRSDIAVRRLKVDGDIAVRADAYVLQDFRMTADGADLSGRVAWSGEDGKTPKLEAKLSADRLDLDAIDIQRFASLSGVQNANVDLTLKANQMTFAKVPWSKVDVDLSASSGAVDIRRLNVADLGGARIEAKGRIGEKDGRPDGRMDAKINAARLDGLVAVLRKTPAPAALVDAFAARTDLLAPAALTATVTSDPKSTKLSGKVRGSLGGSTVDLDLGADPRNVAPTLTATLRASSDNQARLLAQLGLPVVAIDASGPASVEASILNNGKDKPTAQAKFMANGTTGAFRGTYDPSGKPLLAGHLEAGTEDAGHFAIMLGRAAPGSLPSIPFNVTGDLSIADDGWRLAKASGFVQGRAINGSLGYGGKNGVSGNLSVTSLSLSELLATGLGPLVVSGADPAGWPTGPIAPGLLEGTSGKVDVTTDALELLPGYVAGKAAFTVSVGKNEFALQDVRGVLAGGELKGSLSLRRMENDTSVAARMALTDAEARDLVWSSDRPAVVGRLNVSADVLGNGASLSDVIANLSGSGTATLRDGRFAALDPGAFERTLQSMEAGNGAGNANPAQIGNRFQTELLLGDLGVSEATTSFTIGAGVLRAQNAAVTGPAANATASATIDLTKANVTGDITIRPRSLADIADDKVPQADIMFSGPIQAPVRTLDTTTFANTLTVRALEREVARVEKMEAERAERERIAAEEEAKRAAEEAEEARIRAITESTGQVPLPALPPPIQVMPMPRNSPVTSATPPAAAPSAIVPPPAAASSPPPPATPRPRPPGRSDEGSPLDFLRQRAAPAASSR